MSKVVVCSCGKSLRALEGMSEIRCPVCSQVTYFANVLEPDSRPVASKSRPAADFSGSSEVVVFGFDPPAPANLPKAQLKYQVVEVSSETVPPRPSRHRDDDEDGRPYALDRTEPGRNGWKSQEEMWGPNIDLSADPNSPYPTNRREGRRRRRRPGDWALENSWFECLAYPVRAWPLLASLGFALTFATFGLLQVLREDSSLAWSWFFYLIGAVALAYTCGFLSCVLNAGASGDVAEVRWPGANWKILLESLLAASLSFLAGPIIPASLGVYFWVYSGNTTFVDQLILSELLVVTLGYWLMVFFSAAMSDEWSSLLPGAVIRRVRQLGIGRMFMALGFVIGIFLFHRFFAVAGLENHHSAASFILLLFCSTSLLFWMVFLMRWLGVSMYRIRKVRTAS